MLLGGVQIRATDAAAFDRDDYLSGGGRRVVDILNGEGSAWFVEYGGAHGDGLSSGVVYDRLTSSQCKLKRRARLPCDSDRLGAI